MLTFLFVIYRWIWFLVIEMLIFFFLKEGIMISFFFFLVEKKLNMKSYLSNFLGYVVLIGRDVEENM